MEVNKSKEKLVKKIKSSVVIMKYLYFVVLTCFTLAPLFGQQEDKAFIFHPSVTGAYSASMNEIITVIANYYKGVEYSDGEKLDAAFHSSWRMRDNDGTDNKFIHIEDKPTFIKRVKDHGNYDGYASERKFGAIEIIHDRLAFVRIDKAPSRSATLFFLAKIDTVWAIMDKLLVYQEENFSPLPSSALISSIQTFYEVQNVDKDFDSKVFYGSSYEFGQESKLMDHKTKLVSLLGVYDRLAVVRADYPTLNTTAYIVLFRLNTGWTVACERISRKE